MAAEPIDELDAEGLKEVLGSELRGVLVDFWSPWCAPCRTLRPHLRKLAQERTNRWRFVAVNTEEHPAAAQAYSVSSLPTVVFMRQGVELYRFTGAALISTIDAKLDELTT